MMQTNAWCDFIAVALGIVLGMAWVLYELSKTVRNEQKGANDDSENHGVQD